MRTEDQSSTLGFPIFADDSAAIGTGKTGLSISATLAKNGGSASGVTPTYTELGNGIYWVTPIAAHRDTIGCNVWQFSASGAVIAPVFERVRVPPFLASSYTAPDNAGIGSAASSASSAATSSAAAATSAASADTKLTTVRLQRIDRIPNVAAGAAGGLAIVGSEMGLTSAVLGSLFTDTDTAALVNAIIARVESDLDGADLSTAAIAVAVRNEILNRVLSANHEVAGSVGKVLQFLDATISSRATSGQVYDQSEAVITANLSSTIEAVNSIDTLLTALTEVVESVTRFRATALSQAPAGGGGGGGGGGSGDAEQATSLEILEAVDSIAIALAGSSPVEPTGVTETVMARLTRIESGVAGIVPGAGVVVVSTVREGGHVVLKAGDDYVASESYSVPIPIVDPAETAWALLTRAETASIEFGVSKDGVSSFSGSVSKASVYKSGGKTYVPVEIDGSVLMNARAGTGWSYDVQVTSSAGKRRTVCSGTLEIERDNAA
jgi:hypothetical protein